MKLMLAMPRARVCGGTLWAGVLLAASLGAGAAVRAQGAADLKGFGQTINSPQQQRDLDYGTGAKGSSVLDATNPIELMNRLRRATALDDATPPGDAVDAAIRDFHSQPVSPGAAGVKGP